MDSTAQYGAGEMASGTVSTSEEARNNDNPWNTYVYPGLPIGPIANPGDLAIDAAMHPADGPWFYFVTVNLDTGETVFTSTFTSTSGRRAVAGVVRRQPGLGVLTADPRAWPSGATRSRTPGRPGCTRRRMACSGSTGSTSAGVSATRLRRSSRRTRCHWRGLSLTMPLKTVARRRPAPSTARVADGRGQHLPAHRRRPPRLQHRRRGHRRARSETRALTGHRRGADPRRRRDGHVRARRAGALGVADIEVARAARRRPQPPERSARARRRGHRACRSTTTASHDVACHDRDAPGGRAGPGCRRRRPRAPRAAAARRRLRPLADRAGRGVGARRRPATSDSGCCCTRRCCRCASSSTATRAARDEAAVLAAMRAALVGD